MLENLLEVEKGVRVAVTGATGFIGRHLVERLIELKANVEILTRDPGRVPETWAGKVSIAEGDITAGKGLFTQDAQIVFHLAGEIKEPGNFWKTNVEGTRSILKECARRQITRFVHLSSVGVMGIDKAGEFDETSPCSPKNDYERSKLEAERLVLEAGRKDGLPIAILRPSTVYGPGKAGKDSFLSLIRSIKSGYFRYVGTDKGIYNIVYVEDVIEALLHMAISPTIEGGKSFIINDPMAWGDFVDHIQSLLHIGRKVSTIPTALAAPLALGCEAGKRLGIQVPFSISRYKALTSKTNFSSQRLKEELGFKFRFGNREGLKNTIYYYNQKHLL